MIFISPTLRLFVLYCLFSLFDPDLGLFQRLYKTAWIVVSLFIGASILGKLVLELSQLMRLWYLSHRRPAKAQASLRICAVSPEPSLLAHMKYGSRRSIRPKIRRPAPLDGCACAFE